MFHGTLTVVSRVNAGAEGELRAALRALDEAIQARAPHPLRGIEELYFAHWGISGSTTPDASPTASGERLLLFGADVRLSDSLHGLAQRRAAVTLLVDRLAAQDPKTVQLFDALYSHCEGYPDRGLRDPDQVKHYLLAHAVPYNTRHVDFAYRVAAVPEIRELVHVRERVEDYLNDPHRASFLGLLSPPSIRGSLLEHVGPHLAPVMGSGWRRALDAALRTAALATLTYLPLDTPLRLLFELKQRLTPPRKTVERVTVPDWLREQIEARQGPVQNSMILVSDAPDTWWGRLRQVFFMALVNWRLKRNVVGLNDIRTIHMARWALFTQGSRRRLIFMVTYDESWESYIDAFVDHEDVNTFLKLIWSGATGFPSGLPFVEPFKQWIRSVQCPTQAYYSAFLHGGEHPQPFALTDLHELSELRRVLAARASPGVEDEATHRALSAYLEQGRFPYQDKLLSPRQALGVLWAQLRTALHLPIPISRSAPHATATQMDLVDAPPLARGHRPEASPAPTPPAEAGRRSGPRRVWLQAHGGRHLPGPEARGRRPGTSVAAGDPEGRAHDSGSDPT